MLGWIRRGAVDNDVARTAVAADELPGGEGVPAEGIGRTVFEGAVLDQLGVEVAVGGVVDVLEFGPRGLADAAGAAI